ncbi:MAG: TetR/AcrR family transcriptional regulator [Mycobacterium sp.]
MVYVPSDERREQFIAAASKIIREEGLAKATIRRITQEAGATLGSMHYCFRNKEELLEAVSQGFGDEGLTVAAKGVLPAMGVAKATGEILRILAGWIIETKASQIGEFEFYSWAMRSDKHQDIPQRVYTKWINGVRNLLELAATGDDDTLDLDMISRTIIAMADGFNLQDGLLHESRISDNIGIVTEALITAIDHGRFRRN